MADYHTRYERGKVALYNMFGGLHKEKHIKDFDCEGDLLEYIEAQKAKAERCVRQLVKDGESNLI